MTTTVSKTRGTLSGNRAESTILDATERLVGLVSTGRLLAEGKRLYPRATYANLTAALARLEKARIMRRSRRR